MMPMWNPFHVVDTVNAGGDTRFGGVVYVAEAFVTCDSGSYIRFRYAGETMDRRVEMMREWPVFFKSLRPVPPGSRWKPCFAP